MLFTLYEKSSFYGDVDALSGCGCDDVILESKILELRKLIFSLLKMICIEADKNLIERFSNGTDVVINLELSDAEVAFFLINTLFLKTWIK